MKTPQPKGSTHEAILQRIERTEGCWFYPAPTVRVDGTTRAIGLYLYEKETGRTGVRRVLRTCGNQKCVNPRHLIPDTVETRFNLAAAGRSPDRPDCWLWTGPIIHVHGIDRPLLTFTERRQQKHEYAYRWAYQRFIGPIPKGHSITRTCDQPMCVNPKHLLAQSQGEITRAVVSRIMKAKGPMLKREANGCLAWKGSRGGLASARHQAFQEAGIHLPEMAKAVHLCGERHCCEPTHITWPGDERAGMEFRRFLMNVRIDGGGGQSQWDSIPIESWGKDDRCWLWKGSTSVAGGYRYGRYSMRIDGDVVSKRAHQAAWILSGRSLPKGHGDGLLVRTCRNEDCVNPAHISCTTWRKAQDLWAGQANHSKKTKRS